MANKFYELLIRGDDDGKFKGAYYVERDDVTGKTTPPRAVAEGEWPAIAAELNSVSVARVAELEAELVTKETEKTAAAVEHQNALTALQVAANEKDAQLALAAENLRILKEAQTLEDLAAAKADIDRPEIDKKKAELDAEIAAKQAERDALDLAAAAVVIK